ncbi:hypothetical protein BGLA2_1810012 [Burkholderia gladioli]|nr:hypothetical protein BGLA2_1810012 [Burkholderia gladioli]
MGPTNRRRAISTIRARWNRAAPTIRPHEHGARRCSPRRAGRRFMPRAGAMRAVTGRAMDAVLPYGEECLRDIRWARAARHGRATATDLSGVSEHER